MRVSELFNFIKERHVIYERRKAGQPKPWTDDPILRAYRFCNVYRELDKVTVWIRENWREPNAEDQELWFAMTVARMYNLPATLTAVGYPVPYRAEQLRKTVNHLQVKGMTVFNGAYMVRCDCQQAGKTKTDYLIEKVFSPMWVQRTALRPRKEDTLRSFHERLMTCYGMGSFTSAQVVADVKFHGVLRKAADWWTFAAPGPGSQRGLNRLLKRPVKQPWEPEEFKARILVLLTKLDPLLHEAGMSRLSGQDTNNVLCEFDKYERARLGEGRPKQLYPGT